MIMAGMRNFTTPMPFTSPVRAPTASASITEPASPSALSALNIATMMVLKEMTLETDISMPPMNRTLLWAMATIASTAHWAMMLRMLPTLRKDGETIAMSTTIAARMT